MEPWLLFGILLADLWSRFGLLFRLLNASSLNGNPSSLDSMIWCRFWCMSKQFHLKFVISYRIVEGRLVPFCVYFFFSMFSVLSFFSFLSCFLFAGYFGRASAAKRSEAAAGWMSGWMDGWMDCWMDVLSLSSSFSRVLQPGGGIQTPIVLSVFCMLRFLSILG